MFETLSKYGISSSLCSRSMRALLLASAACGGCGMTALKRQRLTQVEVSDRGEATPAADAAYSPSSGEHFEFFAHHKTGTALATEVAGMMSSILHAGNVHVLWADVKAEDQNSTAGKRTSLYSPPGTLEQGADLSCPGGPDNLTVVVYEDMRCSLVTSIMDNCTQVRAVHLVRDLVEASISNYVYLRGLEPFRPGDTEPLQEQMKGPLYRSMSLEDGLALDCEEYLNRHTMPMIEVHDKILRENLTSILEVRSEDVDSDYHGTFLRIFEHFLGSNSSLVVRLSVAAEAFNTDHWSDQFADLTHHVSNNTEKNEVRQVFWDKVAAGDPCSCELVRRTRLLGYPGVRVPDS